MLIISSALLEVNKVHKTTPGNLSLLLLHRKLTQVGHLLATFNSSWVTATSDMTTQQGLSVCSTPQERPSLVVFVNRVMLNLRERLTIRLGQEPGESQSGSSITFPPAETQFISAVMNLLVRDGSPDSVYFGLLCRRRVSSRLGRSNLLAPWFPWAGYQGSLSILHLWLQSQRLLFSLIATWTTLRLFILLNVTLSLTYCLGQIWHKYFKISIWCMLMCANSKQSVTVYKQANV